MTDVYQKHGALNENDFVTDPLVPDPDNLPQPLGWNILVRPYPVENKTRGGIILSSNEVNYLNFTTNIGRVVSVGDACWTRSYHRDKEGEFNPWAEVGDFVSYPRNKGAMRKFKGVSYVILNDDDIIEKLPDPMVFSDESTYSLDVPQEDLRKYNTIHNPNYRN